MRGEYVMGISISVIFLGSPPHAWGILTSKTLVISAGRITPTCVGNTCNLSIIGPPFWDHPHMRGEYPLICSLYHLVLGSPPHAWGILTLR